MTSNTNKTSTNPINWQDRALVAEEALATLELRVQHLEAQLRLQTAKRFGKSSEKTVEGHIPLFADTINEAEAEATPLAPEPDLTNVKPHKRKKRKGQRSDLLEGLPERIVEHRLPQEEQVCSCCGETRHVIREEVSRELQVQPAHFWVEVHKQYVYGCRRCEQRGDGEQTPIVTAPKPARPYPNSVASASAIAYTMDQKYTMGIPLYRQAEQWKRLGIDLSRQTLSNWAVDNAHRWLEPIRERMKEYLLQEDIILADETTSQVLREAGKAPDTKSYMWLYRSGSDGRGIVIYEYQPNRSAKHPQNFLRGFSGFLQTDAYAGYKNIPGVTSVGCFSHARRMFTDAIKAAGGLAKAPKAAEGKAFCDRLFQAEKTFKALSFAERYEQRLLHSQPRLQAFLAWLHEMEPKTLPKTNLGKAVRYCLNQWTPLQNFLLDGRLEIDNNSSERSIKAYVIPRKNFLFNQSPRGAKATALTMSLIESAKSNHLKPYDYLEFILRSLPNASSSQLDDFLPWADTIPESCRQKRR